MTKKKTPAKKAAAKAKAPAPAKAPTEVVAEPIPAEENAAPAPAPAKSPKRPARPAARQETTSSGAPVPSVDQLIASVAKNHREGALQIFSHIPVRDVPNMPSGSLALDRAFGVGGIPKGRVIEYFGEESGGKTTAALTAIAATHDERYRDAFQLRGVSAFVDAEHSLDPEYAAKVGVHLDRLLLSQPECAEEALEIVQEIVESGTVDLVVVDSVAGLVPKSEIDGDLGEGRIGAQARLMSEALRKMTGPASKTGTTVIFINQIREKIGGVSWGKTTDTTGGRALKFYSSVRVDIRRIGGIKVGEENVGNRVGFQVVKNKVAPPFRRGQFDILFGYGIDAAGEVLDIGVEMKVLEQAGAWYAYKGERLGQGRAAAREFLVKNPDLLWRLYEEVREAVHQ